MVTPATAVANLAIPITLYDRAAPPEESHGADYDSALAVLSPAMRKTITETASVWQAYFNDAAFDAETFRLNAESESPLLTLDFDRPLPALDGHSLDVTFTDDGDHQLVIAVVGETASTEAGGATDEANDTDENGSLGETETTTSTLTSALTDTGAVGLAETGEGEDTVFSVARYVEDESGVYLLISIHSRPEASANIRVDSRPGMNVPLFAQEGAAIEIADQVYTYGTPGADYIYLGQYDGRNEDNVVYAGDGNDDIVDYDGENQFYGDGGDDLIIGGEGVDHIIGGSGNVSLSGYHGGDIFIFTDDRFGHDTIWDYENEDVVVLSDLDIGNVRARFEVQSGLLQFKVLVGEEAQWTASIQFYDAPRLQSEQINILLDNDVPLITDEALHHLGGSEQNIHIGQVGADVFHIGEGATDIVRGFDVAQDRLGLDVSNALLTQVSALSDNDAKLALLGEELGLSFDNSASLATGAPSNDAAQTDMAVMIAGEVALILEDTEDEFDFTQLDIY